MLAVGSVWLNGKRRAHMASSVTYARGVYSVVVQATIGTTDFSTEDEFEVFQNIETRDYLIDSADLVLNAVEVLPARGDTIAVVVGSTTYTYEVLAPDGEPVYRWSDRGHAVLRIHTKLTATS